MKRACASCHGCMSGMTRRNLLASAAAPAALKGVTLVADPAPVSRERKALVVQPVLIYQIYKRREQASWRPWGGLFTETEVDEEKQRIGRELAAMAKTAGFPMEILPLKTVTSLAEAKTQGQGQHDVLLMYPATGPSQWLDTLAAGQNWTVVFVRHRSGPVYEYYEIISPRFLRKTVDEWGEAKISTADVVVDSMDEVAVRMRALSAVKNTMGRKVVCIGGAAGWGRGGRQAPERAKEIWKMELPEVTYPDLKAKLIKAKSEAALNRAAKLQAADYLKQKDVKLETTREAVENAFVLRDVFRNIMAEHGTDSITVNHCMGAIMPISETTACMTLSLLNDEGALAFCESDFAVIPSGILLNAISGIPVFLNDPTYPHDQIITLAHCTAPRKMDGKHMEPVRILTHFESDYGAAPKVAMKIGQKLTNIIPDFNGKRWVGFTGALEGNPFLPICRSQIDVAYKCATEKMAEEMRGFHWMTGYGEWSRELAYALRKAGVEWVNLDKG
jgi:hypothetical protein